MLKHGADSKEVLAIARGKLMQSGMAHASRLKKDIRLRVYPKGGFMITVKQHGKQGYHVNRFGLQKPVLMWAEEGTKVRYVRKGGGQVAQTADGKWRTLGRRRGQMPAYHFLDGVEAQGAPIVERDIGTIPTCEILHIAVSIILVNQMAKLVIVEEFYQLGENVFNFQLHQNYIDMDWMGSFEPPP